METKLESRLSVFSDESLLDLYRFNLSKQVELSSVDLMIHFLKNEQSVIESILRRRARQKGIIEQALHQPASVSV